ncbi:tRNA selenocysteine 1-associated protein 1-like isoform X2 [Varroa jacobsoni]|uniref:tRNA selenocysteine 1-associated protein 1-like isoform X2 n=1 Tax=Varroa jacobsoni TaxID=62625 RepID=UPI000BF5C5E7|nr:tRNA selenocysteine 1-associated protein 1-like isoform X2 [Varroa jacobsoni]
MNCYREQQQQQQQQQPPMGGMAGDNARGRVLFNKAHSVWMGDVEPFMTEEFLRKQFTELGLNVVNVRIMHSNKFQDQNITYAFIELDDERTAIRTVQRYNDKPLPGDSRRKFRLNFTCQSQIKQAQDENGLFVGELSPDVDDLALYSTFQERYPSVKWAKVIKDHSGMSKGFGFVKFNHDEEYAKALQEMNGFQGLGANPIRVSQATPKERKNNQQHGGGGGGQWGGGGGPSHHPNPMVAQHHQHMQYFNQATAGFQSPADYYSYYYPQAAAAAASGPAGLPGYYAAAQLQQHYYDQQFRQRQDTARDDSRAATAELEDQGEEMYAALQGRIISADLMSDLEAARYSEMPLIVK